ncbi:hypothetical protein FSPOR_4163 [Fusarium sporotrichioides]|uniref:Heterokaryon incompatibility domain-containing protein n=1 Tax=Fusarium sporotrichioides TaxID=5514 RepID=A0A395SD26_FUSSP|nr:hypothetical protein FSPOR_4163 [Fusarium sporotrichioides]
MAVILCVECTVFKEGFESLSGDCFEETNRAPFQNFATLERSASLGCALCQIIYQTWHRQRYSEEYKENSLIEVQGYILDDPDRTQGIFIYYEGSRTNGFTLADFMDRKVSQEQFSQYQTACRQIIDPNTPDGISQIASLASTWIRSCRQTHQNCGSYSATREPKVLPTRLIDVSTDALSQPRLVIPLPHPPGFEYIALSYAWGSSNFIKTTSSNLESMRQNLPWNQLPKTIQDAIIVTRSLGVRYLWVDALCILQSDGPDDVKHREDWSYEAARFGKYYENALLTIAATGANSSDQGLFRPRPILRFEPKSITIQRGNSSDYTIRSKMVDWVSETRSAPLSKRGWAIQERLLSRRVLHFAENLTLWECHDCRATELDPQGLNPRGLDDNGSLLHEFMTEFRDLYTKGLKPDILIKKWYNFLQIYSKSDFTFVSDRLPALSGIATIIQQHVQQRYVAGLWESDIPRGLAWHSGSPFRFDTRHLIDPETIVSSVKGDSQLILPSWSWAVSKGPVAYFPTDDWTPVVEVKSCEVDSQGTSTSGQIRGARLTVRGVLATINLADLGFVLNSSTRARDNVLGRVREKVITGLECVCMDATVDSQTTRISYPCILIGNARIDFDSPRIGEGLILEATGHCVGCIKEYRRVGFISLPMEECSSIFTDEEVTISLV